MGMLSQRLRCSYGSSRGRLKSALMIFIAFYCITIDFEVFRLVISKLTFKIINLKNMRDADWTGGSISGLRSVLANQIHPLTC